MKIAILGTRGIPARYGGFETFAEELSTRLVSMGHDVTVYCRKGRSADVGKEFGGVKLRFIPTIHQKHLETVVHAFLSVLDVAIRRPDVVLLCNGANALFSWIPRPFGVPVVLNVDGIERLRQKWGLLGRLWYRLGEFLARVCPTSVIADARVIEDYYWEKHKLKTVFIPYGVKEVEEPQSDVLERLGLKPDEYVLYVSRLEPENNAHIVVEAFEKAKTDKKLVIVGNAPYSDKYIADLKSTKDDRILFPGAIYGDDYVKLQRNCFTYVQATEVGGTHPALIEGMAWAPMVIGNDTPENREVLSDGGIIFQKSCPNSLREHLQTVLDDPSARNQYCEIARERVAKYYNWPIVTQSYLRLFCELTGQEFDVPNKESASMAEKADMVRAR